MAKDAPRPAGPLARRWESLSGAAQFAICLPVTILVMWWFHVALLNQPAFWRGFFYGVFWGIPFALLIVLASTHEANKRRQAPPGPD